MSMTAWLLATAQADPGDGSGLRTWAPVASAGIAAVAAGLSFFAVRQAHAERKEDRRPRLMIQPLRDEQGLMSYSITNAGKGLAGQVQYLFACEQDYATGAIDTGFMRPDDEAIVHTSMTAPHKVQSRGVVVCLDPYGGVYAWNIAGKRKQFRKLLTRKPDNVSLCEALKRYGDKEELGKQVTKATLAWRRGGPE
jgi:hypothetical protein